MYTCDIKSLHGTQLNHSVGTLVERTFAHWVALQDGQRRTQLQEEPAHHVKVSAKASLEAGACVSAVDAGY